LETLEATSAQPADQPLSPWPSATSAFRSGNRPGDNNRPINDNKPSYESKLEYDAYSNVPKNPRPSIDYTPGRDGAGESYSEKISKGMNPLYGSNSTHTLKPLYSLGVGSSTLVASVASGGSIVAHIGTLTLSNDQSATVDGKVVSIADNALFVDGTIALRPSVIGTSTGFIWNGAGEEPARSSSDDSHEGQQTAKQFGEKKKNRSGAFGGLSAVPTNLAILAGVLLLIITM
jgi:hypothetical protein